MAPGLGESLDLGCFGEAEPIEWRGWIWVKGQEGGPVGLGLSIWRVTVPLAEMGDQGEKQVWGAGGGVVGGR